MIHARIQEVFQEVFNVAECQLTTSIHSIAGWDSLGHVKLILGLEKKFSLKLPFHEAVQLRDVKTIQEYLIHRGIVKVGS